MRRLLLLALFALPLAQTAHAQTSQIPWIRDPEVFVPGSSTNPLLLYFYDPGSRSARLMATWTFTDPRVIQLLEGVDTISAAAGRSAPLFERYGVAETPVLLLILPDETEVARHAGPISGNELVSWLEEALSRVPASPEETPESQPAVDAADPFLEHRVTTPVPHSPDLVLDQRPLLGEGQSAVEPRHRPIASATAGRSVAVQVQIDGGADRVTLHHRTPGESSFHDIEMTPNTPELYYCVIPGEAVSLEGVEYYIFVSRNSRSITLPAAGPGGPFRIAVR